MFKKNSGGQNRGHILVWNLIPHFSPLISCVSSQWVSDSSPSPDLWRSVGPWCSHEETVPMLVSRKWVVSPDRATATDNSAGVESCERHWPLRRGGRVCERSWVHSSEVKYISVEPGILLVIHASWCQIPAARAPATPVRFHEDLWAGKEQEWRSGSQTWLNAGRSSYL